VPRLALVLLAAVAVALAVAVPIWGVPGLLQRLTINGVDDSGVLGAQAMRNLALTVSVDDPERLPLVEVRVDGQPARTEVRDGRLHIDLSDLPDGTHELTARLPGWMMSLGGAEITRKFTVDTVPPELVVDPVRATSLREPVAVTGVAKDAEHVTVQGQQVPLDAEGRFSVHIDPRAVIAQVVATDRAGNTTRQDVTIGVAHPGMRAVHMSAAAWASPELREPVLQMIRERRIDTVELDIKDESGEVGYPSEVPLAREIGATRNHYDARQVIDQLHGMGVRVVGRLVAFRDPILGNASWKEGKTHRLVLNTAGQPWSGYGQASFTNFADPEVRKYNIDLAVEAAKLGFDDILYDYIRRPDGALSRMRFPGLPEGKTPEQSIAEFLAESREAIRPHGALLGASVFGIASTRPKEIAQDIPAMARHADYISPMLYPSHWAPGEYGVPNPNAQPYDIVVRSLPDFLKAVEGTSAQIIPWLQDFSLGHPYGDAEVIAQIRASKENGISSFLLWNPACRYHAGALEPAT